MLHSIFSLNVKTLKILTFFNKESRPLSQAIIAFGVFPQFLPLASTAIESPEGYSCLAIITFEAFEFIVPKILVSLKRNGQEESRLLNLRKLRSSRNFWANGMRQEMA